MFRNYFLSTLRVLYKEKLYTIINAVGLAIGLATCFLVFSWVYFETSYDEFAGSDRIYRVTTQWKEGDGESLASTYPMVRTRVLSQFPEVEQSARVFDQGFLGSKTKIQAGDNVFVDEAFYYGDSALFSIFPVNFLHGDPLQALNRPATMVITETTARKWYGTTDAVGRTVRVNNQREFEITGVIRDLPAQRHFHFDVVASMSSHPWIKSAEDNVWSGVVFHTYVKLREGVAPNTLKSKMDEFLSQFPDDRERVGQNLDLQLQPIRAIHLTSHKRFELEANGNQTYVYLFTTIGLLVLLVAIINYTNLATARHTQRAKEVGVRKVMGASRTQLVQQFLMESFAITFAALLLAGVLVEMVRPMLPSLSVGEYLHTSIFEPTTLAVALLIAMVVSLITGLAPAFALASFKPMSLFKPGTQRTGGITLRKALVVFQFAISTLLTICTAVTYFQLKDLNNASLGLKLDHTLVLPLSFPEVREKYLELKTGLSRHSAIIGSTATSQLPVDIQTSENIDLSSEETRAVSCLSVDEDFFRVMGVNLTQQTGSLSMLTPTDTVNRFVLNEQALAETGWTPDEALSHEIKIPHGNMKPGPVIAIASDFQFQSLHHPVGPLTIEFNPDLYDYLLVKVRATDLEESIALVQTEWNKIAGGIPFSYSFLDQDYQHLYAQEKQSSTLFVAFATVAIFISLLGLFGLSSFTIERRTKEIGLRKVLGAHRIQIVTLVSNDFLKLLVVAVLLAIPAGYYFMIQWQSGFALKAAINIWIFIAAGLVNIGLGLLILFYHSLRISNTNPIDTLRYE